MISEDFIYAHLSLLLLGLFVIRCITMVEQSPIYLMQKNQRGIERVAWDTHISGMPLLCDRLILGRHNSYIHLLTLERNV